MTSPGNGAGSGTGGLLRRHVLETMKRAFVGKDEIIDLMGLCLTAGENLFLLGPPGTAKSALVRELGRRLEGHTFEYLLTRFTEPSELFGPFDIRRLREGELVTNTEGMLPEASFVFLDELLNANSAILNSLLMVLNERVFRRGREARPLPTLMIVGASNRLPEDEALGALFDRFLVRVSCENVPEDALERVLDAGWKLDHGLGEAPVAMHVEDVRALQGRLTEVSLEEIRPALVDLVRRLRSAGIPITDRRAVKLQKLVAASALLCDRTRARISDLWVFRHVWDSVEQIEILHGMVEERLRAEEPDGADHPRARRGGAPDPEALARDLDALEEELGSDGGGRTDRAVLRDRLGLLGERCQWVGEQLARDQLARRVDGIWRMLDRVPPGSPTALDRR